MASAEKYLLNIKYLLNAKFYRKGGNAFERHVANKWDELAREGKDIDMYGLCEEMMEELADIAYYNDTYESVEEAYYVIVEAIGIDEANDWLAERVY